jgi:hypothetical protein
MLLSIPLFVYVGFGRVSEEVSACPGSMDANMSPSRSHRTISRPGRSLTMVRTIATVMESVSSARAAVGPASFNARISPPARMGGSPTASRQTDTEFVRGLQMRYSDGSGTQQRFARSPLPRTEALAVSRLTSKNSLPRMGPSSFPSTATKSKANALGPHGRRRERMRVKASPWTTNEHVQHGA